MIGMSTDDAANSVEREFVSIWATLNLLTPIYVLVISVDSLK